MSTLTVAGLTVAVGGAEILRGIDLEVRSGEVHAVMGPNGAGKSTLGNALMGHPDFAVTGGSVTLDGTDLLALATWSTPHGACSSPRSTPSSCQEYEPSRFSPRRSPPAAAGRSRTASALGRPSRGRGEPRSGSPRSSSHGP